ncbi:nuclease-related domain-containing protein [Pseudomonas aeruginosa]|uniref:nuclease-related domain-containing protein n=1 Tax=Pseudomonas aeruginosa TaxID=287 RepID=UPI000EB0E03D|nr:nuclease-related domain-containing protein [Pseudomonas aeruginosa]WJM48574.1 nuclease-related domain-containing protein [Pseudomonas aeruginosa]
MLIRHLSHGEDFRLNRCPGSVDHYTQIDHVFLSPYGIFVLETAGFQHLPIGLYRCTGEPCCRSQALV